MKTSSTYFCFRDLVNLNECVKFGFIRLFSIALMAWREIPTLFANSVRFFLVLYSLLL